jgi:nucleosome binding factor SPN SPT16 subunit
MHRYNLRSKSTSSENSYNTEQDENIVYSLDEINAAANTLVLMSQPPSKNKKSKKSKKSKGRKKNKNCENEIKNKKKNYIKKINLELEKIIKEFEKLPIYHKTDSSLAKMYKHGIHRYLQELKYLGVTINELANKKFYKIKLNTAMFDAQLYLMRSKTKKQTSTN